MSSLTPTTAYLGCDVPAALTLREYGRQVAAQRSTGDSRLQRALHGLRLGHGTLRRPVPRFA